MPNTLAASVNKWYHIGADCAMPAALFFGHPTMPRESGCRNTIKPSHCCRKGKDLYILVGDRFRSPTCFLRPCANTAGQLGVAYRANLRELPGETALPEPVGIAEASRGVYQVNQRAQRYAVVGAQGFAYP